MPESSSDAPFRYRPRTDACDAVVEFARRPRDVPFTMTCLDCGYEHDFLPADGPGG